MTPGARIKAATEIFTEIATSGQPADQYLKAWGTKNRYAGSKDRRFLRSLIFSCLRHRASYAATMGSDDPRAIVLAGMRWAEGFDLPALDAACSGEGHAAAPLSDAERAALTADTPTLSLEWPEWALEELRKGRDKAEADALAVALNEVAPLDLRVNAAKAKRDQVLMALEAVGFPVKPTPLSPMGLRIARDESSMEGQNIRALPLFRDGRIEVQDEGSQLVALLGGVSPGEQVVELCAGGGGKTLVLGERLNGKGQLYAFDTDKARLARGQERVKRAELHVVQPRQITPWEAAEGADPELAELEGKADLVYLDVPCSGSGAWRRGPDGKWALTPERLAELVGTQAAILRRGARLVKPGGRLLYVTCSVFATENQDQIARFLQQTDEFEPQSIPEIWAAHISNPFPSALEGALVPTGGIQLSPISSGTDGFFAAAFTRKKS